MATILEPKGQMTRALVTQFSVGDHAAIINTAALWEARDPNPRRERARRRLLRVGACGTIRRIRISDPNDGDDTFLVFHVTFATANGGTLTELFTGDEIAPAAEANAYVWLRWQLAELADELTDKEGVR